jgi:hypothetical protein
MNRQDIAGSLKSQTNNEKYLIMKNCGHGIYVPSLEDT